MSRYVNYYFVTEDANGHRVLVPSKIGEAIPDVLPGVKLHGPFKTKRGAKLFATDFNCESIAQAEDDANWLKKYIHYFDVTGEQRVTRVKPTLKEMQEYVGGYIERIKCIYPANGHTCDMIINEDGRRLQLPENEMATRFVIEYQRKLYQQNKWIFSPENISPIVGNAIVFIGCKL